jgi:FAD/FMN-containing dehydrogenase
LLDQRSRLSLATPPFSTMPQSVAWTRELWEAVRPYSTGWVYVNFLGEEGQDRVRAAHGEAKYERLRALKRKYDPTNFFRLN